MVCCRLESFRQPVRREATTPYARRRCDEPLRVADVQALAPVEAGEAGSRERWDRSAPAGATVSVAVPTAVGGRRAVTAARVHTLFYMAVGNLTD